VEAGFRAGTQPEFEVLRARVDRDNQLPTLNRARADRDIAYIQLRQLLEIPLTEPIELETDLDANPLEVPVRYAPRFAEMRRILTDPSAPVIERVAVRSAAALVELQEANVRSVRAEARPSIAAISNYSNVTYPSNVFTGFGDIRTNWTAGASVTLPILTGGRQRANEAIARSQVDAERARFELAEEAADRDARTAWAEVEAAQSTWEATFNTVTLARRSYEIAEIRFQSGVSTQLELSVVRLQLRVAESNHAVAARDLQVARIRVALLPELPVAEVSFTAGTAAVNRTSRPTPVTPTINGVPVARPSTVIPANPQLQLPGAQ
jgi:outer membrane protein TolC